MNPDRNHVNTSPEKRPIKQEQELASDEVTEVAPGVLRAQLPINLFGLGHVNCYLLEDEHGLAVVDPGLPGERSWTDLNRRLKRAGYKVEDIHTVVITHSHFDHFGGAIRLRDAVDADILTHESFQTEWRLSDHSKHEDSSELDLATPEGREAEFERMLTDKLPWGGHRNRPGPETMDQIREMGRFTEEYYATPKPSIPVSDNQVVRLGRRDWVAIHTPGHTHDHLCLFDPVSGTLFTGDHVLPTITPHISGMTYGEDPLAQFFESLQRMESLSNVSVALPAHGHPFIEVGARAATIIHHHEERLNIIRQAAQEMAGGNVVDYMRVLFRERSWGTMAESEAFAHLEHLRTLGELSRSTDELGFMYYRSCS